MKKVSNNFIKILTSISLVKCSNIEKIKTGSISLTYYFSMLVLGYAVVYVSFKLFQLYSKKHNPEDENSTQSYPENQEAPARLSLNRPLNEVGNNNSQNKQDILFTDQKSANAEKKPTPQSSKYDQVTVKSKFSMKLFPSSDTAQVTSKNEKPKSTMPAVSERSSFIPAHVDSSSSVDPNHEISFSKRATTDPKQVQPVVSHILSKSAIEEESQQAGIFITLGDRVEEKKVSETVSITKESDLTFTTRNISSFDSKSSVRSKSQDNQDSPAFGPASESPLDSTSNQKSQDGAGQKDNLMIWGVDLLNEISPSKKLDDSPTSSSSLSTVSALNNEEELTNYQNSPVCELDNKLNNTSEVTVADISK